MCNFDPDLRLGGFALGVTQFGYKRSLIAALSPSFADIGADGP